MGYKPLIKLILILAFTLITRTLWGQAGLYTVTGDKVNIRSGPGKGYSVISSRKKGDTVTVLSFYDANWAKIRYGSSFAYMSRQYLAYRSPLPQEANSQKQASKTKKASGGWDSLYEIVKTILWLCVLVIIIGGLFGTNWGVPALMLQLICGIGALAGYLIFGNAKAGAVIGMAIGLILAVRFVANQLNWDFGGIGGFTYLFWYLVSLPFYILDLLQFWLAKPWRPLMKKNSLSDSTKPGMRTFLRYLQIPFYIACFPLRFINAVYYNIVIHNLYELSNYILEVAAPSDEDEGGSGFWEWIIYLPVRFFKYFVYHGLLTVIESIIWTVIDTFVPAVTLYHGTVESSADSMLCDPKRNKQRRYSSGWLSGIWNVGGGNYAGDGIYFGIFRKTLRNYQNGSAIVARVTMGKTIDVVLMPDYVYNQAGHPNASAVSNWGLNNGYISGEWWRSDRNTQWWEICMYDRQNRYNDSWRIRPIYAINSNTGIMQRISGGTAHWLFRKMVWDDLKNSIKRIFK